jgi:predicted ATPase
VIKRIRIDGYKSFNNFAVDLRPLSVIFGPNASGKSNLLDAIYLLSRAVTCKNLKEAFEGHRGLPLESFHYEKEGYEGLLKKPQISFRLEVDVEISPQIRQRVSEIVQEKRKGIDSAEPEKEIVTERFLRYRLEIEALPKTGYLRVVDERLAAIMQNGKEKKRKAFIEKVGDNGGDRLHLRMEGQAHPTYHEIGLEHTLISSALYEPHYPHITAFRMELANCHVYYLEPKFLMREEVPVAEVGSLGPRGENLAAFLNVLYHRDKKSYESFNLTLKRVLPTDARIEVEPLKEGRVGLRLSENGLSYSARLISEGTLRLIGLLAAVHPTNEATLIGYEEPENGVHPVRLKIIADLLKNSVQEHQKQIVVTTHSPIFPECFDDSDLFVCRREEQLTTITPFKALGPLYKRVTIDHFLEDRILRGDFGG